MRATAPVACTPFDPADDQEQTMSTPREPYTAPTAPEAISTVESAQLSPSGQFTDADGYSSVAPA